MVLLGAFPNALSLRLISVERATAPPPATRQPCPSAGAAKTSCQSVVPSTPRFHLRWRQGNASEAMDHSENAQGNARVWRGVETATLGSLGSSGGSDAPTHWDWTGHYA